MIRALPLRDKDKLLLRLVAKDGLLLEQLSYRHIEHSGTCEERVAELRAYFAERLGGARQMTPKELLSQVRKASAYVTRHVRVTGDKLSEVELLVDLLTRVLEVHMPRYRRGHGRRQDHIRRLGAYVAGRLGPLLRKAEKLHPDLHLEIGPGLDELLALAWSTEEVRELLVSGEVPKHFT